jgi:formylglycine-generating enzyme required for sulfatase activity
MYDLAGNVSEWVTRTALMTQDDVAAPKHFALVVGGSWADLPAASALKDRSSSPPVRTEREDVGLRLVLDLDLKSLVVEDSGESKERRGPRKN